MKTCMVWTAIATAALAACGVANAQSAVTLYGRVVAGFDHQSNIAALGGKGDWTGGGNQWGTSMIGFKGNEDLGGGLTAGFLLEGGFEATKGSFNGGASAGLFNRRSYVSLGTPALGSLKIGKNLAISNDVWYLDPTGQQFISTSTLVKGRNWAGANNMLEYQSPTWGGFQVGLQSTLGETPGAFTAGRKDGISAVYATPVFEVRAIYDLARDGTGNYSDVYSASKELTLGGTVTLDAWKIYAGYENLRAPDALTSAGAPDKLNHYWVGFNYQVTTPITLIGAVFHAKANNNNGSANLFMVGANYNFSKRTLAYVSYGTVRNSDTANFPVEATNNAPPTGENQNGTYFGLAHSF